MKILSADIGGTNARVAILEDLEIKFLKIYPTSQFTSCTELLQVFSKEIKGAFPKQIVICAAGVLEDEKIFGTNLPWVISEKDLIEKFKLSKCALLNDFEASAYGLLTVDEKRLVTLKDGKHSLKGVKIVLGAGTGLGEAILVFCSEGKWKVIRTEGGHTSFSPEDEVQIELLRFLREKYGHVSHERILSGKGLLDLYEFFSKKEGKASSKEVPSEVTQGAKEGDEISKRALLLFCKIYGQEAGNFALKTLPQGGIYISGGIIRHILFFLKESDFIEAYLKKGRMEKVLRDYPIFVVDEPYLGILGGAYYLLNSSMTKSS